MFERKCSKCGKETNFITYSTKRCGNCLIKYSPTTRKRYELFKEILPSNSDKGLIVKDIRKIFNETESCINTALNNLWRAGLVHRKINEDYVGPGREYKYFIPLDKCNNDCEWFFNNWDCPECNPKKLINSNSLN
ncbi:hypothetical protein [Methanobacterium paludis]|uniref:Uncharacterized protein n=1 Tax=Methanobacterium paludis (strain DSM 25820 / JCM 18151 / SWAN1) TaxID=868131 RepID=F6D6Q1_METPW|nr:hypothetical protein [Methanobacterium paludis]AEG18334.1 hypothetical protein MSWAN_1317 [Methanobacterium paludis]